ncbi:hypothetical protein Patl1_18139 [Pistacia atlantica]|uniref:Uncharacterized protein n=1 Tax=Pistacia atlantica TaxID=434234 RepID=A0ACC1BYW3_9ROSI|nr:hypothetical protein Patl1_18139 [Pistacia atlantica]
MKEQKFYIDEETYKSILGVLKKAKMDSDVVALNHFHDRMVQENAAVGVVKKVANVVLGMDWCDKVEKELEDMKIELSDDFVISVMRELRNYPFKALSFFNWVGEYLGSEHNTIMYNAILRVLARYDSKEEFWSVVEVMKNVGHEMDMDTYIKISRQFHKCKMMEDALENPDLALVFRVAKKYEATGNFLSKPVYDGIHRSLTSVGRFDEAEKIVKVMKNAGYEPDNVTYSQLVFGLCKARRFEEACKVLDEMEENGCIPDIKTWTILIKGHCIANEVDQALMCFAKMVEKNIDADADLLEVLINGFLGQKRVKGAYELLVGMVEKARNKTLAIYI